MGTPSVSVRPWPSLRAYRSTPDPFGKPPTMVMACVGHLSWAAAGMVAARLAAASVAMLRIRNMVIPLLKCCCGELPAWAGDGFPESAQLRDRPADAIQRGQIGRASCRERVCQYV